MSAAPHVSIILAAGKGTRMPSTNCHKVCFPIDGIPAINRALAIYDRVGLRRHIVVVGTMASQVMEAVGRSNKNILFAYQAEQCGRADAARVGLQAALLLGDAPDVFLVAGDRIIEPGVLERLFALFRDETCDLAFLASRGEPDSTRGRVVEDPEGRIISIVEDADIRQRQVFRDLRALSAAPRTSEEVRELMRRGFSRADSPASEKRLQTAFGRVWDEVKEGGQQNIDPESLIPEGGDVFRFRSPGGRALSMTPADVRSLPWMNTSVCVVKVSVLAEALGRPDRANAQGEEYLSGIVEVLADDPGRFKVRVLHVEDEDAILGYNNLAELLAVESVIQAKKKGAQL